MSRSRWPRPHWLWGYWNTDSWGLKGPGFRFHRRSAPSECHGQNTTGYGEVIAKKWVHPDLRSSTSRSKK